MSIRHCGAYLGIFEGHWDPAAAIVQGGKILAYAEEERFVRLKHAPMMYPICAIKSCLQRADLTPHDIAAIAVNWDVDAYSDGRMQRFFEQLNSDWPVDGNTRRWQHKVLGYFNTQSVRQRHEKHWRRTFGDIPTPPIHSLPHHYVHALHSFLQSPFEQAVCITVDGSGDRHCTVVWACDAESIRPVKEICMPHSLGWFYAAFTEYLGFRAYNGEYKVMGLAAHGQGNAELRSKVEEVISAAEDNVEYRLNPSYIHYGEHTWSDRFTDNLVALFHQPMRLPDEPLTTWHQNLAFEVQQALERAMCRLAAWAADHLGYENLCIGGGVGLNAKMNAALSSLPRVKGFFAQPLCSDGGAAAGAALGACWELTGKRPEPLTTVAFGHEEHDQDIQEKLQAYQIPYERMDDIVEAVADELAAGRTVGWFHGPMEAGPRALGQRSILGDPRRIEMRDRINASIKFRENWRPFAPSLPAEDAEKYLEKPSDARFMNITFKATDILAERAPAIVHVDGTTRVQLVHQRVHPLFHRLLRAFERRTGVAVLLNTSFNVKGEPIVCTITDALRTFYGTGLNVLAAGSFLVRKPSGRNEIYE